MAATQNTAAWLPAVGKQVEIGPADVPDPGLGELLIEVSSVNNGVDACGSSLRLHVCFWQLTQQQVEVVAVQPAEYKIQEGTLPIPLKYPSVVGC